MRTFLALCLLVALTACAAAPTATPTLVPTNIPASTKKPSPSKVAPTKKAPVKASPTPTTGPAIVFTLIKADGSKVPFMLADLQKLPTASMTASGKVFAGPKLKDILAAAGVASFTKVYLFSNTGDKLKLIPIQVDDTTLIPFTSDGIASLATGDINKQFWIQDLVRIEVQ